MNTYITMSDLKKENIWVNYYIEKVTQSDGSVKDRKTPYGKTDNPQKWRDYNRVNARVGQFVPVAEEKRKLEGVGFVTFTKDVRKNFTPLTPVMKKYQVVLIDIDSDTGELNQMQKTILKQYEGKTYIEKSRSGKGFHIYGLCSLDVLPDNQTEKWNCKSADKSVELYATSNRFSVVTGNEIETSHPQSHIADVTGLILSTLNQYMAKSTTTGAPASLKRKKVTGGVGENRASLEFSLDDLRKSEIIEKAQHCYMGELFTELFYNGYSKDKTDLYHQWGQDFPSQSEADFYLCTHLALVTNCDAQLITAVFSDSALGQRKNWQDRADYRKSTVDRSITRAGNNPHLIYRPPFIVDKGPEGKGGEMVSPPKLAQYVRKHNRYIFVRNSANSDITKYWYRDGYYQEIADDQLRGYIKEHIMGYNQNLLKMKDVNEVYQQLITDDVFLNQEDINNDEHLINFRNGVLDLKTMKLLPHDSKYLITRQIPCNWDETVDFKNNTAPTFHNYMAYLCDGMEQWSWDKMSDTGKARYNIIMEFLGISVSNVKGHRFKKALFMYGNGNTGKSQIRKLAEYIVGTRNCCALDFKTLEARFGTAQIYGKRLAGSADLSFMGVPEMGVFKKVTGGDTLFAEHKGRKPFGFVYDGVLWFCMNQLPKFGGDQGQWVYDRIIPLPCDNVVPPDKQDPVLLDKMISEIPAIMYEAVQHLNRVIDNGYRYHEPEESLLLRAKYKRENDSLTGWLFECCVIFNSEDMEIDDINTQCEWEKLSKKPTVTELYKVYKSWCAQYENGYALKQTEFSNRLSRDYGKTKYKYGWVFDGFCLNDYWAEKLNDNTLFY